MLTVLLSFSISEVVVGVVVAVVLGCGGVVVSGGDAVVMVSGGDAVVMASGGQVPLILP